MCVLLLLLLLLLECGLCVFVHWYFADVWFTSGIHASLIYDTIIGNWENKKPVWIMVMINSLTKEDVQTRGTPVLDFYLAHEAMKMGKEVGAVETVEEQCAPFNNLNLTQVKNYLPYF